MNTQPLDPIPPHKELTLPDTVNLLQKATHETPALGVASNAATPTDDDSSEWYEP